tara:strand:- start:863 stop:1738 length:876 start_codon:yes stop_codon:yes gene_type:complete
MNTKTEAHNYFGKVANVYGDEYHKNYKELGYYPANYYRLLIVKNLLEKIKPKLILDIGCGTGDPLILLSKEGHNIYGFDYSDSMVKKAKENLNNNNINPDKIWKDNMEKISNCDRKYPCSIALGSLYYAKDFNKSLTEMVKITQKDGDIIFSLRNSLFSLYTLNSYSSSFFIDNLLIKEILNDDLLNATVELLESKLEPIIEMKKQDQIKKNIDELNVHNIQHNPLKIGDELQNFGLKLNSILFYHYHASLPIMEKKFPSEFYSSSSKMENPHDWRGYFMASAFVVHATKI